MKHNKRILTLVMVALNSVISSSAQANERVPKDGWEWTQATFYELYAARPTQPTNSKMLYAGIVNRFNNENKGKDGFEMSIEGAGKMTEAQKAAAMQQGKMLNIATHESAHLLYIETFNSYINAEIKKHHLNSGSFMYDWADEVAAVFCETPTLKKIRRKQLKETIPFEQYLRMDHPVAGRKAKSLPALKGVEMHNKMMPFYAQALAFPEFARAKGGNPFFRHLHGYSINNINMEDIITRWNKEVEIITATPKYQENLKRTKKNLFPEVTTIRNIPFLPGEAVYKVNGNLAEFEKEFKVWAKEKFPTHIDDGNLKYKF